MAESADERAFHAQRVAEFRANGGKLHPPFDTVPLLVLTTIGARSRRPHATPMSYTRDGERIIVVAAAGGAPQHPAWYHNLIAHPEVTVEVGGRDIPGPRDGRDRAGTRTPLRAAYGAASELRRLPATHHPATPGRHPRATALTTTTTSSGPDRAVNGSLWTAAARMSGTRLCSVRRRRWLRCTDERRAGRSV